MAESTHERVNRLLNELPGAEELEIPPPVFRVFGGRFTEFEPGRSITAEWPVSDDHRGPTGRLQGGVLTVYFDNTFGPLAFLAGEGFFVSLDVTTEFVRPVRPEDGTVRVRAEMLGATSRVLFLEAEATRLDGTPVARCRTKLMEADDLER